MAQFQPSAKKKKKKIIQQNRICPWQLFSLFAKTATAFRTRLLHHRIPYFQQVVWSVLLFAAPNINNNTNYQFLAYCRCKAALIELLHELICLLFC
jgi:hypothetical protein